LTRRGSREGVFSSYCVTTIRFFYSFEIPCWSAPLSSSSRRRCSNPLPDRFSVLLEIAFFPLRLFFPLPPPFFSFRFFFIPLHFWLLSLEEPPHPFSYRPVRNFYPKRKHGPSFLLDNFLLFPPGAFPFLFFPCSFESLFLEGSPFASCRPPPQSFVKHLLNAAASPVQVCRCSVPLFFFPSAFRLLSLLV